MSHPLDFTAAPLDLSPLDLSLLPGAATNPFAVPESAASPLLTPLADGQRSDNMRDLEREHILDTLAAAGGSRKIAGERLGMSERTLRHKLKQYRDDGLFKE